MAELPPTSVQPDTAAILAALADLRAQLLTQQEVEVALTQQVATLQQQQAAPQPPSPLQLAHADTVPGRTRATRYVD
jgi:hypothetical protein